MYRPVIILFSCILATILSVSSFAQEDPVLEDAVDEESDFIDEFTLLAEDAMVESAARHKQEIGMSPSAITVITREDIEASGAITIPDLLRLVPGIDVVSTSPTFITVSTRLEWTFENKNFLVLIDGREANTELLGHTFFELQPVSLADIQRIEIIRGPGSSLYGANAYIGVISITTRSVPEETSAWMQISAGEPGLTEAGARASTRIGPWGISLNAGGVYSGAFSDPARTGKEVWKLRSTVDYRLSESSRLMIDAGYCNGEGNIASSVGTVHFNMRSYILRLAYEAEDFQGQLYWSGLDMKGGIGAPLDFSGIRLAEFYDTFAVGHTLDGQVQWTIPRFWDPLLIIAGGGGRMSYAGSDQLLDADTYADIGSPDFHQPGIDHWEWRAGAFMHVELAPADWVTATFGLRFDYNTVTKEFLSPRLAAVFKPAPGQFVRLGVARSFRKPPFFETDMHLPVRFPADSPITGAGREKFHEFMTRVVGNSNLLNEDLVSFEAGYLGQYLDGKLTLTLDLYCNITNDRVTFKQRVTLDEQSLPDLDVSSFMFENSDITQYIFGGELSVRYNPMKNLSLVAWWSHRQVFDEDKYLGFKNPKNLMGLGGRFRTDSGLVGSLYAFSRSGFLDNFVENPSGPLEPTLRRYLDHYVLLLGKIGWKLSVATNVDVEVGVRLYLPINFSTPHFRYHERGGGVTYQGKVFGGEELARMVTAYLQCSY